MNNIERIICGITLIASSSAAYSFDFNATAASLATKRLAPEAAAAITAAKASASAENSLQPTEVEFGYLWGEGETGNKYNISVSQSFDWPGIYRARAAAGKAAMTVEQAAVATRRMSLALEIKCAMIDIVAAKKYIALTTMMSDTLAAMRDAMMRGVNKGEVTRLDFNKIIIEQLALKNQLASDRQSLADAVSLLQSLAGEDVSEIVASLDEFPVEKMEPEATYLELLTSGANPEIASAQATAEAARQTARVGKSSLMPGFSLGYTYENEGAERWHGLSAGITLPITSGRSTRKAVAAAKAAEAAAKAESEAASASATAEVKTLISQVNLFRERLDDYREVYNSSQSPTMLLRKAYMAGQMSLHEYLGDVNFYAAAWRDFIADQVACATALAKLNRLSLSL